MHSFHSVFQQVVTILSYFQIGKRLILTAFYQDMFTASCLAVSKWPSWLAIISYERNVVLSTTTLNYVEFDQMLDSFLHQIRCNFLKFINSFPISQKNVLTGLQYSTLYTVLVANFFQ